MAVRGHSVPLTAMRRLFIINPILLTYLMTEELKNSPIADFDWDAYEKGEAQGEKTREELTKTYDESLNTVKDKDVIEGTIIALNKR